MIECKEYAWNQTPPYPYRETANLHPYMLTPKNWTVPNGFKTQVESIVDETGDDGRFRDCTHSLETNQFDSPYTNHRFYRGYAGNAYVLNVPASAVTTAFGLRVAPSIDTDAYASEALAFIMPRLNEGLSLVNFILELKDLKHMDPRGSLERLRRRHLRLRDLRDTRTRKELSKELITRMNNAALNASFGIVPFVKDLFQIHDDLVQLATRLEALKKYANKPQQRHYKRVIPESPGMFASRDWKTFQNAITWPSGLQSDELDNGGVRRNITVNHRCRWLVRPVYHATARYIYTLPEMDSTLEKVYAHLDTLGVRLDPSIVWNAIPFSFVVDWVVDVSGFLGSFARDNYPIKFQLLDFCHSYKWHKEAELSCSYQSDPTLSTTLIPEGYPLKPGERSIYTGQRSYYSRVRHRPDIHTAQLKAPKLRHLALSGSLMLGRTRLGRQNGYQNLSRLFFSPSKAGRRR